MQGASPQAAHIDLDADRITRVLNSAALHSPGTTPGRPGPSALRMPSAADTNRARREVGGLSNVPSVARRRLGLRCAGLTAAPPAPKAAEVGL
ncbi:hypothetical protein [Streptomyces sp. NPDC088246]|uniref:hypothetical protein n=1 Tax=Streptomyces sp. NPDC088246 TaxID=3365842 RepID=UPI00381FC8D7